MFDKGQSQSAGDNSNQFQANQVIVVNGIDERRVREICQEFKEYALKEIAQTASEIAEARIECLETKLVPRIANIEGGISALCDPEFFSLLKRIQLSAAETSRESDYDMLSELLCHRIKNKNNLMNKAAINKAVSIVNQIDDQALLALTIFYFAEKFHPISGIMRSGLELLDNTFAKLLYEDLPIGKEWIDHLELLDALRYSTLGRMKKLSDYYAEKMEGYWCGGLKIDSDEFVHAQQMLQENNLPCDILVTNELDVDYVRVCVVNKNAIKSLYYIQFTQQKSPVKVPFTDGQTACIQSIYELSTQNNEFREKRKKRFCDVLLEYPSLKKVIDWWGQIDVSIDLTAAGCVLAHANARRCSSEIPSLE